MEVKLIESENNPRHLEIWLGDDFLMTIDKRLYRKNLTQIRKMTNIHEDVVILEQKVATNYLLSILARRAYTTYELRKKLKDKLISITSVDYALEKVSSYLSDDDLIESIIRVEISKGKGGRVIEQKVIKRSGKAREVVKDLVAAQYVEEDQLVMAIALVRKKLKGALDYKTRAKVLRFLVGRGFSYQTAQEALTKGAVE